MEPADPDVVGLWDALTGRVPGGEWRTWRGVNGQLYAWRKQHRNGEPHEPPLLFRGAGVEEVLAKVAEWVATGRRPDE